MIGVKAVLWQTPFLNNYKHKYDPIETHYCDIIETHYCDDIDTFAKYTEYDTEISKFFGSKIGVYLIGRTFRKLSVNTI